MLSFAFAEQRGSARKHVKGVNEILNTEGHFSVQSQRRGRQAKINPTLVLRLGSAWIVTGRGP